MIFVPRGASDEQVLDIVRVWVDVLAREDYDAVFAALGLSIRGEAPGPECIRGCIKEYRSPDYYSGVEDFTVTDWRTAQGGNPKPQQAVTRYAPNSVKMVGAASFDLPLNGRWSDLTADFVFFENGHSEGYVLALEEISSWEQLQREEVQRDMAASEQVYTDREVFGEEQSMEEAPAAPRALRVAVSGEHLSRKRGESAA